MANHKKAKAAKACTVVEIRLSHIKLASMKVFLAKITSSHQYFFSKYPKNKNPYIFLFSVSYNYPTALSLNRMVKANIGKPIPHRRKDGIATAIKYFQ